MAANEGEKLLSSLRETVQNIQKMVARVQERLEEELEHINDPEKLAKVVQSLASAALTASRAAETIHKVDSQGETESDTDFFQQI